ncbi:MAG: RidA family protein [Acidimicrobiia bacterium]|nr:RidA family protein [Acidimicrobiia bacterium]
MTKSHAYSGSPYELEYGFSRAIRVGNRIEVAGTAPIPPSGRQVADSAYEQMRRCGEIMLEAIAELGGSAGDVTRTRMFIINTDDADDIGRAHQELFGEAMPVATMVVVASLLDPSWKVEAEAVAIVGTTSQLPPNAEN